MIVRQNLKHFHLISKRTWMFILNFAPHLFVLLLWLLLLLCYYYWSSQKQPKGEGDVSQAQFVHAHIILRKDLMRQHQ